MIVLRRLYSRHNFKNTVQRVKRDPGVYERKRILQELEPASEFDIDMDDLESDFMSVHKSHKEHLVELERRKEKEKYLIVKQKYFKEKFPNFLTWHDKEQIRYLHNNDPEEWTIDRLAEGFPALPDVINKIIKGKWVKSNQTKISTHDSAVLKNWNDFKEGKLHSLPEELKDHLKKFTSRTLNLEPFKKPHCKEIIMTKNNEKQRASGEFSEIISSYQRLQEANSDNKQISQEELQFITSNTTKSDKHRGNPNSRLITFKQLQKNLLQHVSKGKEISLQDKMLQEASSIQKDVTVELSQDDISNLIRHKHETSNTNIGFVRKTSKDMSHLMYPEKIVIPNAIYKRGYTYKLNDCYYDSDGEFLYRVPGMG